MNNGGQERRLRRREQRFRESDEQGRRSRTLGDFLANNSDSDDSRDAEDDDTTGGDTEDCTTEEGASSAVYEITVAAVPPIEPTPADLLVNSNSDISGDIENVASEGDTWDFATEDASSADDTPPIQYTRDYIYVIRNPNDYTTEGASSAVDTSVSEITVTAIPPIERTPAEIQRVQEIRAKVEAIVRLVMPEEANHIDHMMAQFEGREEDLLMTLRAIQRRKLVVEQQRRRLAAHGFRF